MFCSLFFGFFLFLCSICVLIFGLVIYYLFVIDVVIYCLVVFFSLFLFFFGYVIRLIFKVGLRVVCFKVCVRLYRGYFFLGMVIGFVILLMWKRQFFIYFFGVCFGVVVLELFFVFFIFGLF